jgi:hypothetical protein
MEIVSIITEDGEIPIKEWRSPLPEMEVELEEDEDEDEDEDEEWEDPLDPVGTEYGYEGSLVDDDVFEDRLKYAGIRNQYPTQHILKVIRYTGRSFVELDEWLKENCRGTYKRIGWASGCSTTVAVVFWDTTDAVLYRMRWQ